jgi:hypothetical protein
MPSPPAPHTFNADPLIGDKISEPHAMTSHEKTQSIPDDSY